MSTLDRSKLLEKLEKHGEKLEDITELDLSNEKISRISNDAFEGMINLSKLDLSQNEIAIMDWKLFSNLPNLKELNLSRNKLEQIDEFAFKEMTNLSMLDLSENEITDINSIEFSNLENITELNLSSNKLKTIQFNAFEGMINLSKLDLSQNQISDIFSMLFSSLDNLSELNLSGNKLNLIKCDAFEGMTNLSKLDLSQNEITDINSVLFSNLTNLTELSLSRNKLSLIKYNTFEETKNLSKLDLSQNEITKIDSMLFSNLTNLRELNLSSNKLKLIKREIFSELGNLEFLYLEFNEIEEIGMNCFENNPKLTILIVNGNKISSIPTNTFLGLNNLVYLSLEFNYLTAITSDSFENLPSLKELNVASNRLKKINPNAFKNQVALESLDMSNNQIMYIDSRTFRDVKELKSLNLSSNKLKSIEPNIFKGLEKLEFLYLNNNLLTSVDRDGFKDPVNLRVLKLNNNKLNYFETDCFANFRLIRVIQLYENPEFWSMSFYNLSKEEIDKNSFEEHRLKDYGYLSDWEEYLKNWNNLSKQQPLKSKKTFNLLEDDVEKSDISSISKEESKTIKNISSLSVVESKTWSQEHTIIFDEKHRKASLEFLNLIKDGTLLCIAYSKNSSVSGLASYQHWFIMTNDERCTKYFIEFGSIDLDYDNARVNINIRPRKEIKIESEFRLTDKVRQRIDHVLGMKNFSLCLRNSEHVANYIYDGKWLSKQVESFKMAIKVPMGENAKNINIFPSKIIPHVLLEDNEKMIYSFLSDQVLFKPTQMQYFLDDSPNTYNVLLIGPIGAGKSRLLNVIFNRNIVESKASFSGVTKDIILVRGRKINKEILPNFDEVILADTVGLCDTEWGIERMPNYIKGRIIDNFQNVDVVLVAMTVDRLLSGVYVQNIRKMLDWLNYEKYSERFVFVITKSYHLNYDIKRKFRDELRISLSLLEKTNDDAILFTDFPYTDDFTVRQEEAIRNDFKALNNTIFKERQIERIPIKLEVKDYERSRGSKNDTCNIL